MPRPSKTDQEQGAMKDLWLEIKALEAEHSGVVSMHMIPTERPGVFSFNLLFTSLLEGQPNAPSSHSLQFVYPNAERSPLAAFLWRKAIALSRMVQEEADNRAGRRITGG